MLIAWNQLEGTDGTTSQILCQCMYDESWAGNEGWVMMLGFTGWRSHKYERNTALEKHANQITVKYNYGISTILGGFMPVRGRREAGEKVGLSEH